MTRGAIVTGGARGIGRAIVERLVAADHHVLVIDVNEKAIASLGELEAREQVTGVLGSTLDRPLVERAVNELVDRCGRVDAVVNNAGLTLPAMFLDQTDDDWDRIVDSNLKGAFVVSQVAARYMVERRSGAFVNISSISAHGVRAENGPPAYAAAKAGLEGLGRLMAVQLAEFGIRVNTVVVGTTATPWLLGKKTEDELTEMRSTTLLGELADPDDIAAAIAFLVSDDARHITGQLLSVSGGQWLA